MLNSGQGKSGYFGYHSGNSQVILMSALSMNPGYVLLLRNIESV